MRIIKKLKLWLLDKYSFIYGVSILVEDMEMMNDRLNQENFIKRKIVTALVDKIMKDGLIKIEQNADFEHLGTKFTATINILKI